MLKDRRVVTSRCLYFLRFSRASSGFETDIRTCVLILRGRDGIVLPFFRLRICNFFTKENILEAVPDTHGLLLVEYLSIRLLARRLLRRKEFKAANLGIFEKSFLLYLKFLISDFEKAFTFKLFFKIWRVYRACY